MLPSREAERQLVVPALDAIQRSRDPATGPPSRARRRRVRTARRNRRERSRARLRPSRARRPRRGAREQIVERMARERGRQSRNPIAADLLERLAIRAERALESAPDRGLRVVDPRRPRPDFERETEAIPEHASERQPERRAPAARTALCSPSMNSPPASTGAGRRESVIAQRPHASAQAACALR